VKFGDSDKLRLGEWVIAIGNPFSLGGTVTAGIVSARNRDINSGPYDNYIQTDAPINRGNSGGPLFNLEGEVVGINTAIISPSGGSIGIGFSVPSKTAVAVIDQLKQFGETRRGWLGVRIQLVTDEIAESLNIKPPHGALVAGVDEKGPAKPAGIEAGDVIVKFDGKDVGEMRRLPRIVAETPINHEVEVQYFRDGKRLTTKAMVGELVDDDNAQDENKPAQKPQPKPESGAATNLGMLGISVAPVTAALRDRFELPPEAKGLVITDVAANGQAAEQGLRAGDLLISVDNDAVKTGQDVLNHVETARKANRRTVLLYLQSQGDFRYITLRVEAKK